MPLSARRRTRIVRVLLCFFAAIGLTADTGMAEPALPVPPGLKLVMPVIAAHRGGARIGLENSLSAYRNALALGVGYLETDVHLTADGVPVLLHDPHLERTTTGIGPIGRLTASQLARLSLRSADGRASGEKVPTLEQLLEIVRDSGVKLLLEIKLDPDRRRYPGVEEKVLGMLEQYGVQERTVVMSFDRETLRKVRALSAGQRTTLLVGRGLQWVAAWFADPIRQAQAAGATDLGIHASLIHRRLVERAHGAGLKLAAWTVNGPDDMHRLAGLGIDVLITDRPDLAVKLWGHPPAPVPMLEADAQRFD